MSTVQQDAILIHVESGRYPVTVPEFKKSAQGFIFGESIPEAIINQLGYAVVDAVEKPVGDVVREQAPQAKGDGRYQQIFSIRAFNEQEKLERLALAKEHALEQTARAAAYTREHGAPYTFGDSQQHIQLREVDISNLTGLAVKAMRDPSRTYYFRSFENTINPLTGAEVTALIDFAFEAFERFLETYWGMQTTIANCATLEQVPSEEAIRTVIINSVK